MVLFIVSKLANDYMIGAWSEYQLKQDPGELGGEFTYYCTMNFVLGLV